jgi:hypothetical protein
MSVPRMTIADLDDAQLATLRALEDTLGVWLVALQPEYRLADLSEEKLRQLQATEKKLGVVLLAYETEVGQKT